MSTLTDFAVEEAIRISASKKAPELLARAAARRAPGLKLAAEALHRLLLTGDPTLIKAIPECVSAQVRGRGNIFPSAPTEQGAEACARIERWLRAAPYVLSSCRSVGAALAAAAPVAMIETQNTSATPCAELEVACLAALSSKAQEVRRHRVEKAREEKKAREEAEEAAARAAERWAERAAARLERRLLETAEAADDELCGAMRELGAYMELVEVCVQPRRRRCGEWRRRPSRRGREEREAKLAAARARRARTRAIDVCRARCRSDKLEHAEQR